MANNPRLMVLSAVLIVLACIGLIAGVAIYEGGTSPSIGGSFALQGSNGQIITDRSFPDKYKLIYFGYTYCPDVCPTTMADLAIAMKDLGAMANKVQPLFITVDPQRDTVEVLKAYTAQFSTSLIGLTGTPNQIAAIEKKYKVYAQAVPASPGDKNYQVDHSSIFYVMDPKGKFVTVIPADSEGDVLAKQIARNIQ